MARTILLRDAKTLEKILNWGIEIGLGYGFVA
jgi:hypothetical protein